MRSSLLVAKDCPRAFDVTDRDIERRRIVCGRHNRSHASKEGKQSSRSLTVDSRYMIRQMFESQRDVKK